MRLTPLTASLRRLVRWAGALGLAAALPAGAAEPITPIPLDPPPDSARVALGERLFNDPRLSRGNRLSCATCHVLTLGAADGQPLSTGVAARARRNTPTLFNASLNFRQFWDGRAESLEQQLHLVMRDPAAMGAEWSDVLPKLNQDAATRARFLAVYPNGVQLANVVDALVAYQQSLTTPNARFDRWLRGDATALNADEAAGYGLFKRYGCVACHQGVNVGGNMFQVFGVMAGRGQPGRVDGPATLSPDAGRFDVTGYETDRYLFKVPTLRNIALTAPYLHDGSASTLEEAIVAMFVYQLGRRADADDVARIAAFLRTLTGEYRGRPLDRPPVGPAR